MEIPKSLNIKNLTLFKPMFSSLPGPGAFLAIPTILAAIFGTLLAVILKLCGVLLLSWWWVLSPVPLALVAIFVVAGALALFES